MRSSQIASESAKVPQLLSASPSQIPTSLAHLAQPLLLSHSLSHLFSHPTCPLSDTLATLRVLFTYSTDALLDSIIPTSTRTRDSNGGRASVHVVLVDANRLDVLENERKSIVDGFHCRTEWKTVFQLCLTWNCAEEGGIVRCLHTWEEAVQETVRQS